MHLCVLAAYLHERNYFLLALPMRLEDVLVPFSGAVPAWVFEAAIFLIALGAFEMTWRVTRKDRWGGYAKELSPGAPVVAP